MLGPEMRVAAYIPTGLALLTALLWTLVARQSWEYRLHRSPHSRLFRLVPVAASVIALNYASLVLWTLIPGQLDGDPRITITANGQAVHEALWLLSLALLRHLCHLMPVPESAPRPRWLIVNYGIAATAVALDVGLRLWPEATLSERTLGHRAYEAGFTVLGLLALWEATRVARPGAWVPDPAGEIRRFDVAVFKWGALLAFVSVPIGSLLAGLGFGIVLWEVVLGVTIAVPFVFRMLGAIVPELIATVALLAATGGVLAAHAMAVARVAADDRPLVHLGAVLLLGVVTAPGQRWLRARIQRAVLRRGHHQQAELQAFLHTLSPEAGVAECCRRALAELVRVRQVRGAAIVLRDGEAIVAGEFDAVPLIAAWPRGAAADRLPARSIGSDELRELPASLRDALARAGVWLGTFPILSPRRRWGHLFMSTGLLGGVFNEDDVDAMGGFVAQLALLLDGADLLARAVAVERSLAHAEKLAAIGELAARMAHEIRNPLTAARSLAQLIAREPAGPHAVEHAALVVAELDRVERQVAALLRFARKEEYALVPLDVGALVGATAADLRVRLEPRGIALRVVTADGVMARADGEKLRQVLVNLVDNAVDAVASTTAPEVAIAVDRENGSATIRVQDNGPGVSGDVLAQVFEPFFSQKEHGTGLGLAIAKRTVEAHGGRIVARNAASGGMLVEIELPLGGLP